MRENTHMFSYYIVKAAIYSKFDKFKEFIKSNGLKLDSLAKQEHFIAFVKQTVDDEEFWKDLKRTRTRTILLSTLKMTKLAW
jgi:hypothetical protein